MQFELFRADNWSNIFLIIKKNNKELPLVVYGILKVIGKSYLESSIEKNSILDELVASGKLIKLEEQSICLYFEKV